MRVDPNMDPVDFWQQHYEKASPETSGRPSAVLERFVKDRASGNALELGCGKGDDAVWLVKQGWQVTAIDLSETALDYARANAARNGVADKITFAAHDLMTGFPDGKFDLITAQFLESPVVFERDAILHMAANRVLPGGMLLIASHGSVPSWSWDYPDKVYPTPQEAFDNLNLDASDWNRVCVDNIDRMATGPTGEKGTVTDTVIALERKA